MYVLLSLGLLVLCKAQDEETAPNRCDEQDIEVFYTQCTSCAASPLLQCPKDSRRVTLGMGTADCSYNVQIGGRRLVVPGCRHRCEMVITVPKCCPNFWGPLCISCPSWYGRPCNMHGECVDGIRGNGTCVCHEGITGSVCQDCTAKNVFGALCNLKCMCYNDGECDSGPSGDGKCYCQPPYAGASCLEVSPTCTNCGANSYCKGEQKSAVCDCLPGFKRTGAICTEDVCSTNVCDHNAECTNEGNGKYQCKCKDGYIGDGKLCVPINPCDTDHGGCPVNSTNCLYISPGKSRCECKRGMEGSSPRKGCTLKHACVSSPCHRTAQCYTGPDGNPICSCRSTQISDGKYCYGNIMERLLELDREGALKARLSATITVFEKECQLMLTKHGPFTAFVPLLVRPIDHGVPSSVICKRHLILGQRLLKDLQSNDYWLLSGETIRFKNGKRFIITQEPYKDYLIVQNDLPAANGIIHVIDTSFTKKYHKEMKDSDKTIKTILESNSDFSRFQSLLDNCGATLPLGGPGPLTVFVPSNEALDRARDGSYNYMLTQAQHKLHELLKHHIFTMASITVDQLATMPEFQTMAQETITVNITNDGRIVLSEKGILLESRDIVASNGIIHIIDGVFIPQSIIPILPHRCDILESKIVVGQCVKCNNLKEATCPPGAKELRGHVTECEYIPSDLGLTLSSKGCAKLCNSTYSKPQCCDGFFGPECKPCIGGFQHPCYDKGICNDGIEGNGVCSCYPGFAGIGCHVCSSPVKHGENCSKDCQCVHGECDNRPGSNGVCRKGSCKSGYAGELCHLQLKLCDETRLMHCHYNAGCVSMLNGQTSCVCSDGYEGDGYSCVSSNPCLKPNRGGCDIHAQCIHSGSGNISCVCNEGWTGDGLVCTETNNCLLESRGGCDINADCYVTGPAKNTCTCQASYTGNGITCNFINPCNSDNGGCHPMALCNLLENKTHVCVCYEGYAGNGKACFRDLSTEVLGHYEFYSFSALIRRCHTFEIQSNTTALIPSLKAFRNVSKTDRAFWFDSYRLPYLLKAHFLDGVFTADDLKKMVNSEVQSLNENTTWEIKNRSGDVMLGNATIVTPDIQVLDGYIHVIDKVLLPAFSEIPPPPSSLMDFLNSSNVFSLFLKASLLYNLTEKMEKNEYTLLLPTDKAVKEFLTRTNSSELDEDTLKYHVIVDTHLLPEDIRNGLVKPTLLGSSYQIIFHTDAQNESFANEVHIKGNYTKLLNGVAVVVNRVLEIHKNICNRETALKMKGRCGACDEAPLCYFTPSRPVENMFPVNMKSNCIYRKMVGTIRMSLPGCVMDCLRFVEDHGCCPGYYGHTCLKCPGQVGSWCSNHGKCQDGFQGNGECQCDEGFNGTACETCQTGRYGPDCKSVCNCDHGWCHDGINGTGKCLCHKGWKGPSCSVEIPADACGGVCHEFANCITGELGTLSNCSCVAGYQGDGISCTEINPCDSDNGGCSKMASCIKTSGGGRSCSCHKGYTGDGLVCLEIDPCSKKNGGCHNNAQCIKTGPKQVACSCITGYSGNGHFCYPENPCRKNNGGCDIYAWCEYTGPGRRRCKCRANYLGNGFTCRRDLMSEITTHQKSRWFSRNLKAAHMVNLQRDGRFTVFIPEDDFSSNFTSEFWDKANKTKDLMMYHMVSCKTLMLSELKYISKVTSLQGLPLVFSFHEGVVYINNKTKIINSDYETTNGVIHFIDRVLVPYDINTTNSQHSSLLNVTAAAEAYGYHKFSKLLQDSDLMRVLKNHVYQPFTMLWPMDAVFNALSEERKKWLYSPDHRDKLEAYLRVHIISSRRLTSLEIATAGIRKTMYGSALVFQCNKKTVGDIRVDNGNAGLLEFNLEFDIGVAHGIDQLLEPPNLGARCNVLKERHIRGRCGSCDFIPDCQFGTKSVGQQSCLISTYYGRLDRIGCQHNCVGLYWDIKCCKNHYGRNCQVCPGGLDAPCSNHGTCDDGFNRFGICRCHDGFMGTACELCRLNHYGPDCAVCTCVRGSCNDGMNGDGSCFCQTGWTGLHCQNKLEVKPVCNPECDSNAVCQPGNICECAFLYEGDGRNCTVPDLCSQYNGGCHEYASCAQAGVNVSCSCLPEYKGDGFFCLPIDPCIQEENGGCSEFASCLFTGPNKRECQCNQGYVGNGILCLEKVIPTVDRCLENNGGCDPKAVCKDLHYHENTAGVFHLRSPAGKNKLNYTDAISACKAEQATLATVSQLSDAQQLGMHLCEAGWMDKANVGYPVKFPSSQCGDNPVGIVLYKSPVHLNSTYDAYCYRIKDVHCECGPLYVGDGYFCNGDIASIVATRANFSIFYSMLLNSSSDEGQNILMFLSTQRENVTLFVPHDSGFSGNETLSTRDLEYHISANNSVHFYDALEHNGVISSQLGYNICVVVFPSSNLSKPSKLVDHRLIVEWDIPAVNGIIHVIEGPMKAPPPIVSLDVKSDFHLSRSNSKTASIASILTFCLVLVVMGAFFYVKHKKNPYGFSHFWDNEDQSRKTEDEASSALVSFQNPMYRGSSMEPFCIDDEN